MNWLRSRLDNPHHPRQRHTKSRHTYTATRLPERRRPLRPNTEETPRISVTADVVIARKLDIGYITLFIRTDGLLLEDAVKEAASKVDQVQRTLRETYRGIKDIQIQDIYLGESKPAM